MEFPEAVAIPTGHAADKCPFCPLEQTPNSNVAKIGKDNDSTTLGNNLDAAGDDKQDHLYFDVEYEIYRDYSAEAHHLICGNEVLKEEAQVEKYLIKDSKTTTKGAAGWLQPNDTAYDVNCAENGIWLPSVPDMYRKAEQREPDVWWGDQTKWNRKKAAGVPDRDSLEDWARFDSAFIVMESVKRQFHKGPHENVGEPHENYVVMAIGRLRQVTAFLNHFRDVCPMEADGTPKTNPPYYPPHGLPRLLHLLSENLRRELTGPPETWNYYISDFAMACSKWWKRHLST